MATVNPWGVTSDENYASTGTRQANSPYPSVNAGFQTFSTMQKAGMARPPAPAPAPYSPAPLSIRPYTGGMVQQQAPATFPRPSIDPGTVQRPPVTVPRTAAPASPLPNPGQMIENRLTGAYANPRTVPSYTQGALPMQQILERMLQGGLDRPSAYDSEEAKRTFDRLNTGLSENFNVERQKIQEEMARRGLGDSTIYGGRLGDVAIQQARAQSDLAGQIAHEQAQTSASDRASAIAQALGYGQQTDARNQQNFQNQLGSFQAGNAEDQRNLQNLLGFGQQGFQNQLATANLNNEQTQQQLQFLLQLFGMV